MRTQFYELVLPKTGTYCATGFQDGKAPKNVFSESIEQLLHNVDTLNVSGLNACVALHTFNGYSRKGDNAQFCKSLFIDLDVGAGEKYSSKADALTGLGEFIEATQIAIPIVVDSGGGIHAYWALNREIPSNQWASLAEKFKGFCQHHGLKIDPVVTTDRARVLRAPDTKNYKYDGNPIAQILSDKEHFVEHTVEYFYSLLGMGDVDEPISLEELRQQVGGELDDDTRAFKDNYDYYFIDILQRTIEGTGCAQLDYAMSIRGADNTPRTLEYPFWRAMLSITANCLDGEDATYELSKDSAKYSPGDTTAETDKLINASYTCSAVRDKSPRPTLCDACPHFRPKSSRPIDLGRRLKEAPPIPAAATQDSQGQGQITLYQTLPASFFPFSRGPRGGVWYTPKPKRDEEGETVEQDKIQICTLDFQAIQRKYGAEGEAVVMRVILPNDGVRDVTITASQAGNTEEFKKIVRGVGILPKAEHTKLLQEYVDKWIDYWIVKEAALIERRQLGWHDNNNTFVVGREELHRDGTSTVTAAAMLVDTLSPFMRPEGSYDVWKSCANALNRPGYEIHAFAMLCGFGSALMRFTRVAGATIGLFGKSGEGKTMALFAAASVWGNPSGITLSNANAGSTANAAMIWALGLRSIVFGLDEASNFADHEISSMLHSVSSGKGKLRMASSSNTVRTIEQECSNIAIMTTNHSMISKVLNFKGDATGELARYLEFKVPRPPGFNLKEGERIAEPYRTNYGHAGPDFIKHVFALGESRVRQIVTEWQTKYRATVGDASEDRFFESIISAALGAGQIAKDAGIIDIDLLRVFDTVVGTVINTKANPIHAVDYVDLLNQLMVSCSHKTVQVRDGNVIEEPRNQPIVARVETRKDEKTADFYITPTALREFLADGQKGDISQMIDELVAAKKMTRVKPISKKIYTGTSKDANNAVVKMYLFHLLDTELPSVFREEGGNAAKQ